MSCHLALIHWDHEACAAYAAQLHEHGYDVVAHSTPHSKVQFGDSLPAAFLFCLDKLPSHSVAIAEWVWEAKKRQSIPIIFFGGAEDKVAKVAERFPAAHFCPWDEVPHVLSRVLESGKQAVAVEER